MRKNLSSQNTLLILLIGFLTVIGCQLKPRSSSTRDGAPSQTMRPESKPGYGSDSRSDTVTSTDIDDLPAGSEAPEEPEVTLPPPPMQPPPKVPKVGLILGPGGAKAWAHIGLLHEIQRNKIPVRGIVGIEWAAPMAALYSQKGLSNEVEWQMFKLQDSDFNLEGSGLFSGSNSLGLEKFVDFFKLSLGKSSANSSQIVFGCPAFNYRKKQTFMMSRGTFHQLLPYCISLPPLHKPFHNNYASTMSLNTSVDYLRKRGANLIVFVNVLEGSNDTKGLLKNASGADLLLWSEIAASQSQTWPGVDEVISINMNEYYITDFNRRREILSKGREVSGKAIEKLMKKWNL